ncbi:MAG: tetratricopeptide repeat protein [Planctomycetes bacterium]|nr:tetratricopeptide repeat protein [Planctomycetota bacterium]
MQDYDDRKPRAIKFFEAAYRAQMEGDLDLADQNYQRSIAFYPTPEAFTFYGWCRSFRQEWDEAIELCERAIEIDSEYGNPYNDIGAYLIQKGDLEEAVPWLENALRAERYACPFFAYYNLGQVFEEFGDLDAAEDYYRRALEENPDYTLARVSLSRVLSRTTED